MVEMLRIVILAGSLAACVTLPIRGVVYVDRNGDGTRQDGEPGLGNVVVSHEGKVFARTDPVGAFELELAPETPVGIVWARVPAGFRPGPVWTVGTSHDLGVIPLTDAELATPVTFIVGADTHTTTSQGPWTGGDLADAFDQATSLPSPPRFLTVVGDVTNGNQPDQFEVVDAAVRSAGVPWIPVPGNHDWYDGGTAWRARWGPDNYSFDIDQLHIIVWDTNLSPDEQIAFFEADLANVSPDMTVLGLGHDSPPDDVADRMSALGVDYLFTGHWHANRRVERTGLVEWGTQTFVMGSIDQSPSGYRIVTFDGDTPIVEHRARLVAPQLDVTAPHRGSCAPAGPSEILVAAALDADTPTVTARLDCGPELALSPRGGWSFGVERPALSPGTHRLDVHAESSSGRQIAKTIAFNVCDAPAAARVSADWPQVGGGPMHTSATTRPITPPVTQLWATSIGGNLLLGSPVVKDGVVVVASWDLGSGDQGGLVALDLVTGAIRWKYKTPYQARSAPAIDGDTVVAVLNNGEVHALSLQTGELRWLHDAAEGQDSRASATWASPTIANGIVYVTTQQRMSGLDLDSGAVVWARDLAPTYPWLGTLAAVAVSDDLAIATFNRDDGMTAWTAATGTMQWKIRSSLTMAINATPVISGDTIYIVNSASEVSAIDLRSAVAAWSTSVTADSNDWMYTVTATPALADGRLFVPTQWKDLVVLDAATGDELWRATTPVGTLNFAHYRDAEPGFAASPVVTGDILWLPRPDGTLAALRTTDGTELWSTTLGAPVVSAPTPAGDYLVVATFDGTVRALASSPTVTPDPVDDCPSAEPPPSPAAGCCSARADWPGWLAALCVFGFVMRRRR
jgi:outer membrane protein assembly factor BamB